MHHSYTHRGVYHDDGGCRYHDDGGDDGRGDDGGGGHGGDAHLSYLPLCAALLECFRYG